MNSDCIRILCQSFGSHSVNHHENKHHQIVNYVEGRISYKHRNKIYNGKVLKVGDINFSTLHKVIMSNHNN